MCKKPEALLISDLTQGGAVRACARLHRGLKDSGVWDSVWIAAKGGRASNAHSLEPQWMDVPSLLLLRAAQRLRCSESLRWRLDCLVAERTLLKTVSRGNPRVISLHNIHDAMSFSLLEHLPRHVPVECMLHGLIPVVTSETGIDVSDFGELIHPCTVANIRSLVSRLSSLPVKECMRRSRAAAVTTSKEYTEDVFVAKMKDAISKAVEADVTQASGS